MISKELMVMADVDRSKTLDEIMFVSIPIWVRIMNLPLGLMNKDVGVTIGKEVGEYMMVDLEDGDVPIRRFLSIRVYLVLVNICIVDCHMYSGESCPPSHVLLYIPSKASMQYNNPSITPILLFYMVSRVWVLTLGLKP